MPRNTPGGIPSSRRRVASAPVTRREDVRLEGAERPVPEVEVDVTGPTEDVSLEAVATKRKKQEEAIELEAARRAVEERDAELRAKQDAVKKAAEVKAGKGGPPKDIGPMPKKPRMEWAGKYDGGFSLADVIGAMFEGFGSIKENKRRLGEYRDSLKTYYRDMNKYGDQLKAQISQTRDFVTDQGRLLTRLDKFHERLAEDKANLVSNLGVIEKQLQAAGIMGSILPKENGSPREFRDSRERDKAVDVAIDAEIAKVKKPGLFAREEGKEKKAYKAQLEALEQMRQQMKKMDLTDFTPDMIEQRRDALSKQYEGVAQEIKGLEKRIAENEAQRNGISTEIRKAENLARFNVANYVPQMKGVIITEESNPGSKWTRAKRMGKKELLSNLGADRMTEGFTDEQHKTLEGKAKALAATAKALGEATGDARKDLKEQLKRDAGEFAAEYAAMRKFGSASDEMKQARTAALQAMREGASGMMDGPAVEKVTSLNQEIEQQDARIEKARKEVRKLEGKLGGLKVGGSKETEKAKTELGEAKAELKRLEGEKLDLQEKMREALKGVDHEGLRNAHEVERARQEFKEDLEQGIKDRAKEIEAAEKAIASMNKAYGKAKDEDKPALQGELDEATEALKALTAAQLADQNELQKLKDPVVEMLDKHLTDHEAQVSRAMRETDQRLLGAQEELAKGIQDKIDGINKDMKGLEEIDEQLKEKTDFVDANKARITEISDSLKPGSPELEAGEKARLEEEKRKLEEENRVLTAKDGPLHQLEKDREQLQDQLEKELKELKNTAEMKEIGRLEQARGGVEPSHAENPVMEVMRKGEKLAQDHGAIEHSRKARHDFGHGLDKPGEDMRQAPVPAHQTSATGSQPSAPGVRADSAPASLPEHKPGMVSQLRRGSGATAPLREVARTPEPEKAKHKVSSSAPGTGTGSRLP